MWWAADEGGALLSKLSIGLGYSSSVIQSYSIPPSAAAVACETSGEEKENQYRMERSSRETDLRPHAA